MALYVLLFAVLVQGIGGVAGGYGLVSDPSGSAVGLPLEWLEGTPFSDYRLPGVMLFSVLGVFPLSVTWALCQRRRWSWYGGPTVGAALVIWIVVEIVMIGYKPEPPLQAIYGGLGIAILCLCAMPTVRRFPTQSIRRNARVRVRQTSERRIRRSKVRPADELRKNGDTR